MSFMAIVADRVVPSVLLLVALALSPFAQHIFAILSGAQRRKADARLDNRDGAEQVHSGYIIPCQIHHARMLPRESRHSFRYPSLYYAVHLQEMEAGLLNSSFGFAWHGRTMKDEQEQRWSLTKLNPADFGRKSFPDMSERHVKSVEQSILLKLLFELRFRHYLSKGPQDLLPDAQSLPWAEEVGQIWAIAMPTVFGFAGFNPLTVYYVYRPSRSPEERRGALWLSVLEVHNTFNERHIYVCEVGKGEDKMKRKGYDHAWTFNRDFHVSPFNDRLGYYQLLLRDMWSPNVASPTIDVRLLLLTDVDEGTQSIESTSKQKKLLATLASSQACSATSKATRPALPLTSKNIRRTLLRQPFDLFLPVARIMWEAAKLHWKRKLPVYIRPEPRGEAVEASKEARHDGPFDGIGWPVVHNPVQGAGSGDKSSSGRKSGDIYWNDESTIEKRCREAIFSWLAKLTVSSKDTYVVVKSINPESDDVEIRDGTIAPLTANDESGNDLEFLLLSSAIFVDLCIYQPSHAFLFGSKMERLWGVNSTEALNRIFAMQHGTKNKGSLPPSARFARLVRISYMRWATKTAVRERTLKEEDTHGLIEIATRLTSEAGNTHPLDEGGYSLGLLLAMTVHVLTIMATTLFSNLLHVTYVRPPWAQVGEGMEHLIKTSKSS